MAQEILSRHLEAFRKRWKPKLDAYDVKAGDAEEAEYCLRHDQRDFEVELMNLVHSVFAAAQAPFAAELDTYRQCARDTSLLERILHYNEAQALAKRGIKISGEPL